MIDRMYALLIAIVLVLGFSVQSNATLLLRGQGTSVHGTYNLIYDDDLNVTWYDYSNAAGKWSNQVAWASALSVNFSNVIYDDWRLPSTVDGLYTSGFDGTTTAGYNIISSEMGHLYYAELGNLGNLDHTGKVPSGYGLRNTGDFHNLLGNYIYWSETVCSAYPGNIWQFYMKYGSQYMGGRDAGYLSALAVRNGDVSVVPEPGTLMLMGFGIVGLILWKKKSRQSS